MARSRLVLLALVGAPLGLVGAAAGWLTTDWLERDNDFCNACHLSEDVPLHLEIRRDFDARPPDSLAAAHARVGAEEGVWGRPPAEGFRCIDCHGGVGPIGRSRVKLLAARDAFWWVVGHFEEPEEMAWPLWDEDCRQCHVRFEEKGTAFGEPAFHDLAVHNVDLGMGCVDCHLSHEKGGNVRASFLHPARVRARCAECHGGFRP